MPGFCKAASIDDIRAHNHVLTPGRYVGAAAAEEDDVTFEELPHRTKADPPAGGQGRSKQGKMLVAGAVEVTDDGKPGRARLAEIHDASASSLHPFIAGNLATGVTIKTDGWTGYPGAPGVIHQPHVIGPMAAHIVLPWSHRLFSNLKRRALGVYHGLRRKHLQSYLDEFVFRFNRRRNRPATFLRVLGLCTRLKPTTYQMLLTPEAKG